MPKGAIATGGEIFVSCLLLKPLKCMTKKILYGFGGVILLLIVIASFSPTPETAVNQNIENVSKATSTDKKIVETGPVVEPVAIKPTVPVEVKTTKTVSSPSSQYTHYSVISVVDGDTIKISMNGKEVTLRLIGMDTPETVDPRKPVQCFGKEASNKAKELLSGKKVIIEIDPSQGELDKYGRTLAYVYRDDGLFYNKYMIEQGYAHEYTYNTQYKYQVEFKLAQKTAQSGQLGLWSPNTCNGDTTSTNTTTQATPAPSSSGSKFYTSSYYSAKYYYPETCDGWKSLSADYLKSFDTLEALLSKYPSKIKSPQCN